MTVANNNANATLELHKAHARDVLKHFEHLPHEDQTFVLGYLSALEPTTRDEQSKPPNTQKGA